MSDFAWDKYARRVCRIVRKARTRSVIVEYDTGWTENAATSRLIPLDAPPVWWPRPYAVGEGNDG